CVAWYQRRRTLPLLCGLRSRDRGRAEVSWLQLRKGVNCDLALPRKALHISVRVIEWNALDIQRRKRPRRVPLGYRNWFQFLPVSLRQNEPTRLVNKAGKSVFFVGIFLAALARDRHAQ